MTFKEEKKGDVTIVYVHGKLMGGMETSAVHDRVHVLAESGVKKLVLDLSQVKWMNSSGLGVLMSSMTTMKLHGGDLRLSAVIEKVESLLMITQLLKIFKTYKTVEEAVQSFSSQEV
ncbi:MAG TPA: STAS domain-containing protein [bacterium]|nr:STAS domain-containing protein [bacterium]